MLTNKLTVLAGSDEDKDNPDPFFPTPFSSSPTQLKVEPFPLSLFELERRLDLFLGKMIEEPNHTLGFRKKDNLTCNLTFHPLLQTL